MRTTDELRLIDTDLDAVDAEVDAAIAAMAPVADRDLTPEVEAALKAARAALKAVAKTVAKARGDIDREYAAALKAEEDEAA
jgi:acyl-CoA reductase-like NAD-dependent aldehyde dehydrogenase